MGELLYIELKSGHSHGGPAWIARVTRSRSGRTVYFNGRALKRTDREYVANHFCKASGDLYWVSGVKKDGLDRHTFGRGPVQVEQGVVEEYLALRGIGRLNPRIHVVIPDLPRTDVARLHELENPAVED